MSHVSCFILFDGDLTLPSPHFAPDNFPCDLFPSRKFLTRYVRTRLRQNQNLTTHIETFLRAQTRLSERYFVILGHRVGVGRYQRVSHHSMCLLELMPLLFTVCA
jgi:hypothetical protein